MLSNIDILLTALLTAMFLYGLYKGLISVITPAAAVISVLIISPLIYNQMSKYFNHSIILKIISLIASYSIIRIILSKVEKSIKDILKIIYLSWIDRLMGGIVILFISCSVIYLIMITAVYLSPDYEKLFSNSIILNNIFILFKRIFSSFENNRYTNYFYQFL